VKPGRTRRRQETAGADMGCAAAGEGKCMCGEAMKAGFFGGFGRHGMVRARRATSRGLALRARRPVPVPGEGVGRRARGVGRGFRHRREGGLASGGCGWEVSCDGAWRSG
jgi:hypothetical protein